jgi:murein DD-endopeptidase MepM/ murein hydrolase activator NlpD
VASNRHASVEDLHDTHHDTFGSPNPPAYGAFGSHGTHGTAHQAASSHGASYGTHPDYAPPGGSFDYFGPAPAEDEPRTEWNPSEDTVVPVRGRHRVVRQRGGTIARSRAVLGVGVIAAVGAGGMATANENGAGDSVPGLDAAHDTLDAIPVVGDLLAGDAGTEEPAQTTTVLTSAGLSDTADAGEALRARILLQAEGQETGADAQARAAALSAAEAEAAAAAADRAAAERAAEEERRRQEEEERQRREEEERLRQLRASYTLPLADYRLTSSFGASGAMWQSTHTGQDFAAPTGTPIRNVHTGTVTEAAWAGSYGYRVIVTLEDGTEIWYCHLSSMSVAAGQEVVTGDSVGRVGSTGNSSGAHLHLEVLPGGGDAVDPLAWLRGKGLTV